MSTLSADPKLSLIVAFAAASLVVNSSPAWNQIGSQPLERQVHGQTVTSISSPAVEVTVGPEFTYVGGERTTLSGNADAELHLFAKGTTGRIVQSFYWLQFEHFLPTNSMTYEAASTRTIEIGGLTFNYDTLGYADFAGIQSSQPGSDGAAAVAILARRQFTFPQRWRVLGCSISLMPIVAAN